MATVVDSGGVSPVPHSWEDITDYISASADESEAMVRALMLRLRMPQATFSREWTTAQPQPTALPAVAMPLAQPLHQFVHDVSMQQQQQQQVVVVDPAAAAAAAQKEKKKKKKKKKTKRRSTQPCGNCRRRHRRCNSDAGMGTCSECAHVRLMCTFAT